MSRDFTDAMKAAITDPVVRPCLLYEGTFRSTTVYWWSGIGNIVWNGNTYLGIGHLLQLDAAEEVADVSANGIKVQLSGAGEGNIVYALQEMENYKPGVVRLALFGETGGVVGDADDGDVLGDPDAGLEIADTGFGIIGDPKVFFRGLLDQAEIDDTDPTKPVIGASYENRLIDLERPRELRFTDEAQKSRFPDDTGLRYVVSLQNQTLSWGNGSLG